MRWNIMLIGLFLFQVAVAVGGASQATAPQQVQLAQIEPRR